MRDKSMNTMQIKQINKNKVFKYIYENKTTCKLEITRNIDMGLSTVNQNLKVLEEEGLIQKNGYFESTGGRKADAVEIIKDAKVSIGVAILKKSFDIVALNLYGQVIDSKNIICEFSPNEEYYKFLSYAIDKFINKNNFKDILGVSIAMQSIVSKDGQSITYGKILENHNMKLSDIQSFINYPCRMEHDSKAAASLELWKNKNIENAILLLLNENMGGAIISTKSVLNGDNMRSGTFEHMRIDKNGEICYCGKHGCLETYCSASSLRKKLGIRINKFFKNLDENKDKLYIWEEYLDILGFAISNLSVIVDGKIIISGYVANFFRDEDITYLLDKINESATFNISKEDLIISRQGEFTQSIGSGLYYIKEFLLNV